MSKLTIRRLRTPDAVLGLVEGRLPLSVDIVDRVNRTRERSHWKAHVIAHDEQFCGLFFQYRLCRGKWEAILILDSAIADPDVERFINRAHVWSIGGPGGDVAALLERLPRLSRLTRLEMFHERTPPEFWSSLPGAVALGPEHLDRLIEFFSYHERFGIPTMSGIREFVTLALQRGPAVVFEEDDEIVAGVLLGAATDEWIALDGMSVRPDHRGSGLSTILLSGVARLFSDQGVGMCGVRASTNPGGYETYAGQTEWFVGNLRPPKKFRGHQRLRVLLLRLRKRPKPWGTRYVRPEYLNDSGELRDRPADTS